MEQPSVRWTLVGLLLIASVAVLYVAKAVFAPLLVALLLKLILAPPVRWLRRFGLGPALAAGIVVLSTLGGAGFGIYWVSGEVSDWAREGPERIQVIEAKLQVWRGKVAEVGNTVDNVTGNHDGPAVPVRVERGNSFADAVDKTWQVAAALLIVGFLSFFLLSNDDIFLRRLVEALPRLSDKRTAVRSVREIESRISRYLATVTLINGALGVLVGCAMAALGMPSPLLWGVMAAMLNFVPYAGALVGVAVVALVSLASFDSTLHTALPPLVYLAMTAIEGNLVTPLIIGRNLALNPTAVFVSVLVWGFMWGVVGVMLAVPVLIALRVTLEASPRTAALGSFLASDVTAPPSVPPVPPATAP